MSRWYDERPMLGKKLDEFKEMNPKIRQPILVDIIYLVKQKKPSLFTKRSFQFDSSHLRWYEHDPYCWFVFNLLELADVSILKLVENYFRNRVQHWQIN